MDATLTVNRANSYTESTSAPDSTSAVRTSARILYVRVPEFYTYVCQDSALQSLIGAATGVEVLLVPSQIQFDPDRHPHAVCDLCISNATQCVQGSEHSSHRRRAQYHVLTTVSGVKTLHIYSDFAFLFKNHNEIDDCTDGR